MARIEGQSNSESEAGRHWRNVGLGLLIVGWLGSIALLAELGVLVAAGGEIYRRANDLNE
jgi:hypothetical protein